MKIKRLLDFSLSLLILLLLFPVIIVLVILIALNIGRPVFFSQMRPGVFGKVFKMYKFRTMKEAFDEYGEYLPDEMRLTRFGSFLRSTSLDELPGLWNVLKGDMSLVGPRPLLVEYIPLYSKEQSRRHNVRPGITGWAQVNGRNAISWEQKFKLDVWYIDNQSLLLDFKILWLTLLKVFFREGINQKGSTTMKKFKGSSIE